jgi:hypothetical protein
MLAPVHCDIVTAELRPAKFPVGASPTRQPLQPEAIGAVVEVTKWLKPSIILDRMRVLQGDGLGAVQDDRRESFSRN